MAGDPQIELRVSRLENDSNSIYDLIGEIRSTQQEHSRRLDALDGRLVALDGRLVALDGRFGAVDGRLVAVDGRFDAVDGRLASIETTLIEVVRRLPEPS